MDQKVTPGAGSVIVPANLAQAGTHHTAIGKLLAKIISLKARYDKRIAYLKSARDIHVGKVAAEALLLAHGEELFVTEHKRDLFGNGTKLQMPEGGSIEWKLSPMGKLEYEMEEDAAVALLEKLGLKHCVNYRPTVYKNKLKDAMDEDPKLLKKLPGFSVEKGMVFRMRFNACKTQIKRNTDDEESQLQLHTPVERGTIQTETASS